MAFAVPAGWVFQSSSNNGNTVTYALPGHTTQKPKLAIFSRVVPSYNAKTGWSVPSYRVRVLHGVVDSLGNPIETRTSFDATFRHSMSGNGASEGAGVVQEAVAVIGATGFAEAVFGGQNFPTQSA